MEVPRRRSTFIAYVLWGVGFFGLAGLHRLYLGRTGWGLVYLFTCGLLVVGQILDLLELDHWIEEWNEDAGAAKRRMAEQSAAVGSGAVRAGVASVGAGVGVVSAGAGVMTRSGSTRGVDAPVAKEVHLIREVIMVRCPVCTRLHDETLLGCPACRGEEGRR